MTWSTLGTVGDLLDHEAAAADALALLAPAREALTYDGLRTFVPRIAGNLRAGGIDAGDRVALLVENGPEAASAFLAISSVATVGPLNPAYRAHELEFFLDDLDARAVVVSDALDTPVREVARSRGIGVLDLHVDLSQPAGIFTLDGVPEGSASAEKPEPGAVALALHTSGTTSRPKLVPLTHRQLVVSAGNVAETLRLEPTDRCLNVMPLFHIHGLVTALLATLRAGGSVACTPGFHQCTSSTGSTS